MTRASRWYGVAWTALSLTAACQAPSPDKPMEYIPPPTPVRSPGAEADTIVTQLIHELARDPVLRGAEIRVSVTPTGVRLGGFVHTAAAKLRATELAQDIGRTPRIDNRLVVRRSGGMAQRPIAIVFL